jgi:uncharacterized lipoprotein YddW (UPF0748 family)
MTTIDSIVSHGDWFNAWGSFGRPSVIRILQECHNAGIRKVHWRTFLGARAHYHSAIEPVAYGEEGIERPGYEADARLAYDLREWDPLVDAVDVAHSFGIKIGAWSTIAEETHVQVATTRFAEEHPEFCCLSRDGYRRLSKLSFAFPEVREYKLALIREQLAYGVDEITLDWFRENQTYEARHHEGRPKHEVDASGTSVYGYESASVESFRSATGLDPHELPNDDARWVAHRASHITSFIREASALCHEHDAKLTVIVRSMLPILALFPYWEPEAAPTNSLLGSFVDWPAWAAEGVVDNVMVLNEHYNLEAIDLHRLIDETRDARRRLAGSQAELSMGIWCYNLDDAPVAVGRRLLREGVSAAVYGGADAVTLWETTPIHGWGSQIGGGGGVDIGLWRTVKELTAEGTAIIT